MMPFHYRHVAWLALVVALQGNATPHQIDVRESLASCSEPTVIFPAEAQKAHLEGRAVVYTVIDTSGNVSEAKVQVSSGRVILDVAALTAARTIKCPPFRDPQSGEVTSVYFLKPFVFKLQN
ncbi:energy transducer TonB [Ralstonia pseudosolanacearum]|uniref:energy transducer TonB n=2 Tax=Ralstonia pseudosolanacearum TaxID=1310165 RepID=UPI003D0642B2